jgi:hypothetical protein
MAQRLKGQEIVATVLVNGVEQISLHDVKSLSITPNLDVLEEGYLGETTNRFDEIFKGVKIELEVHTEDEGVFAFIEAVKNRAQRRTPGTTINIQTTLQYANGQRPRIVLKDVFFADSPFNVGSRSDYASLKLSGSCSDFTRIG